MKVVADSNFVMLCNTEIRWSLSPRRDCPTEGFLMVSWEISGRIKNRPGGFSDSLALVTLGPGGGKMVEQKVWF